MLKNYQELIARLFAEGRNEYFGRIMLSDCCQQRLKLLIDVSSSTHILSVCLFVHLLSVCEMFVYILIHTFMNEL